MKDNFNITTSIGSKTECENKIAVIIPYFGKWPEWLDLFMYSCEQNKNINFILFTDCKIPAQNYQNIKFNFLTFSDYCQLVSERLKIDFSPESPYKLCDLKPFYGFIHKDILLDYDFWGFGDMDVIWGDIRGFYTDDLLLRYDVFSTHNDRLSGHFSLFRNNNKYIHLCFKIDEWEGKLKSQNNYALDEADYSQIIFPESKIIGKFYRQIMMRFLDWKTAWVLYYSVFPIFHWILRFKKRRLFFREEHTTPILGEDGRLYKYESDVWYYKDGIVTNNRVKRDYIYLHFMIYKKNNFRSNYFWKDDYYRIEENYDFMNGVKISKSGFESL